MGLQRFLLAAIVFVAVFGLLGCKITRRSIDARGLPENIEVTFWQTQSEPYLVETTEALLHLRELMADDMPAKDLHSLRYFAAPEMEPSVLRNINTFMERVSNATGISFVNVVDPNEDVDLAFLPTKFWKYEDASAEKTALRGRFKAYTRWNSFGCLFYKQAHDANDPILSPYGLSPPVIGTIIIDEDLANIVATDRFRYGLSKYSIARKCIAANILIALGLEGIPNSFDSASSDPVWAPKNITITKYDFAALRLKYYFNVDVNERVKVR